MGFTNVSTTGQNPQLMQTIKQTSGNYATMLQDGKMVVGNIEPDSAGAHREWTSAAIEASIQPALFNRYVQIDTRSENFRQFDIINASMSINLKDREINQANPSDSNPVNFMQAESQRSRYQSYFTDAVVPGSDRKVFDPQIVGFANAFESLAEGTAQTPGIPVIAGAGNSANAVNAFTIMEGKKPGSQVLSVTGLDNDADRIPPEASTVDIHVPLKSGEPTAYRNPDGSIELNLNITGLREITLDRSRHAKLYEHLNMHLGKSVNDSAILKVSDLSAEQQEGLKALGLNGEYISKDDCRNLFLGSGGNLSKYVIATYNANPSGQLVSADLPTVQGTSIASAIATGKITEARLEAGIRDGEITAP